MFGLGLPEVIFIVIISIVVVGPERMPRVARKLGNLLGKMRSAATTLNDAISKDAELSELRKGVVSANDHLNQAKQSIAPFGAKIPNAVSEALNEVKRVAEGGDSLARSSLQTDQSEEAVALDKGAEGGVRVEGSESKSEALPKLQTSSLFAHIESHFNLKSAERTIRLEKAIFVSTPIALATSRIAKKLPQPKDATCFENTIALTIPKKGRAFERVRVLSAGKDINFRSIPLSQVKP